MMNTKHILFLLVSGLFLLNISACKSSKDKKPMNSDKYKSIAQKKYGKDAQIDYLLNKPKTFVICKTEQKKTDLEPFNRLKFLVYDIKNEEILLQESFNDGSVKWVNETTLKAINTPGIVKTHETLDDYSYTYNVTTKKKIQGGKSDITEK